MVRLMPYRDRSGEIQGVVLTLSDISEMSVLRDQARDALNVAQERSQQLEQQSKVGLRPIRLHDLRHLSASIGYAAGEDEWQISRRLGHTDPSFTKRVYTDLWDSTKAEGASKRGSLLDTGTDA